MISYARDGITHAFRHSQADTAFCGWRRFNFNKKVDMEPYDSGYGYVYTPPTDVFVTCLRCLAVLS